MEGSVSVLWWEEVLLCRCKSLFRKDEVGRQGRKSKEERKDPPSPTPEPPTQQGPSPVWCTGKAQSLTTACTLK